MSSRILLLGRHGQVGWELERSLQPLGEVIAMGREQADLARPDTLAALVRELRPGVIVNAAAYTAVDRAEDEEGLAWLVNAEAVGVLADAARESESLLIHYSTDYVFDGKKENPYVENDSCAPINVYGRTKLAGEEAVTASGCAHLIFRTSWVYSHRRHNFLNTMRQLMADRDELRIVGDQLGAPTPARLIADVTACVLAGLKDRSIVDIPAEQQGIFHLTTAGFTSWHGFAEAILQFSDDLQERQVRLLSIPSHDYPTPARRPQNSRLDCTRLQQTFGIHLPNWQNALRLTLDTQ